ncbi:MAG: ROK family protein [Prevotella sp.]|jgi:glucokinase|nr:MULTISPECIES: ROK family protein [unclassified Prevotella]MCI1416475.1 ROK family protein [Prevotella sp.]
MKTVIDLGGTSIRAMRINGDTPMGNIKKIRCHSDGNVDDVIKQIEDLIECLSTENVSQIGIAVPSVVDINKGIVYNVTNIPSWHEVHLKDIIQQHFGIETHVDNDANCFALGEQYYGEGQDFSNFIGITLGTGLGSGIIINKELYRGNNADAGEIGALPYLNADFEHYTSSLFLAQRSTLTGEQLAEAAAEGNGSALSIWNEFGQHLGHLLQAVLLTYDPEAIILGGGLSHAAFLYKPQMRESLADGFPYPNTLRHIHIIFTKLQNANLLGASKL